MTALTPLERSALLLVAVLTALAGVANYQPWPAVPRFAIATLALAGLAWVVSFATEQLGERFGPGVTGMLQSTLGNLPELFVVIFALKKGELVVAQTAIVGSILANALLVLGLVIVVGARALAGRDHALLKAPAARHGDAAAGDRLHHRAARSRARLARPGEPPRAGDLRGRRGLPAGRLPRVGRALPALRRGARGRGGARSGDWGAGADRGRGAREPGGEPGE